jgi:hypothetical protein
MSARACGVLVIDTVAIDDIETASRPAPAWYGRSGGVVDTRLKHDQLPLLATL